MLAEYGFLSTASMPDPLCVFRYRAALKDAQLGPDLKVLLPYCLLA